VILKIEIVPTNALEMMGRGKREGKRVSKNVRFKAYNFRSNNAKARYHS